MSPPDVFGGPSSAGAPQVTGGELLDALDALGWMPCSASVPV